jgi:hypothetical protein
MGALIWPTVRVRCLSSSSYLEVAAAVARTTSLARLGMTSTESSCRRTLPESAHAPLAGIGRATRVYTGMRYSTSRRAANLSLSLSGQPTAVPMRSATSVELG